jgi:hypothetical protein
MLNTPNDTHEVFRQILRNPSLLRENLQQLVEDEQKGLAEAIDQVKDLTDYLRGNWQAILLAFVSFSIGSVSKGDESPQKKSNVVNPKQH